MPIGVVDKTVALLISLTDQQIEALPPAERRRLENECLRVAVLCAPVPDKPASGVLVELAAHRRET